MRLRMVVCLIGMSLAGDFPAVGEVPAGKALTRYEFHRIRMGTPFKLVLYAPSEAVANAAASAAFDRIGQLDRIFSDFDPDSELSRLCRSSGPGHPVLVSRELGDVLSRSLALSARTRGAFDVTVGPAVVLWRKTRRQKMLPTPSQLADARRRIGFRSVHLDREQGSVELAKDEMRLDFGGIAKGYAGDEALTVLRKQGLTHALIDGGGDVVVGDAPPGKRGWRIGIAPLDQPDSEPTRFLLVQNAAVATSGDAYRYVEIAGQRYSHIVDPQTGLGLTRRCSVSVLAPDGLTADSLASAVCVLGPECGLPLVETTPGTAALIVQREQEGTVTYESERLHAFIEN
jgi:thiamine biosynthesis lipoprotein